MYRTFEDLYRYCYLVASVVGLVCIRIFGYTDEKAEHYAEHVGIAFQLTNILRDVKEDAERGRVYLPLAELKHEHVELEEFAAGDARRGDHRRDGGAGEARGEARGRVLSRCGGADSAAGCGLAAGDAVLVSIYEGLLDRISANPAAVFHKRVSVPTVTKLAILGRGMFEAWRLRRRQPLSEARDVVVVGAGVAGLAAAVALSGAGARVVLLERKPYVGGRAYSYLHPALNEVIDSQHVLLGCCTNLIDLCRLAGIGAEDSVV